MRGRSPSQTASSSNAADCAAGFGTPGASSSRCLPPGRPKGGIRPLGGQRTYVSVGVVHFLPPGRPKGGNRPLGGQRTYVSVGVVHFLPPCRPKGNHAANVDDKPVADHDDI